MSGRRGFAGSGQREGRLVSIEGVVGITPQEFVAKWGASTLTEKAASQSHFEDLCRLLDQPTPTDADQTGDFYTFEKGATKAAGPTKGKRGWADVWKKGHFAWE
ncbi:MAG: hypothetical protein M3N33_03225 [Actinomycetota bacterium]|nr:hypothetical protein [Actinomycetota bacterium]